MVVDAPVVTLTLPRWSPCRDVTALPLRTATVWPLKA
jgi:hypothetical protein